MTPSLQQVTSIAEWPASAGSTEAEHSVKPVLPVLALRAEQSVLPGLPRLPSAAKHAVLPLEPQRNPQLRSVPVWLHLQL